MLETWTQMLVVTNEAFEEAGDEIRLGLGRACADVVR